MASLRWLLAAVTIAMVNSECFKSDTECVFHMDIEHHLTMMRYKDLLFPANGKLYKYDVTNTSEAEPITDPNVISADGWEDPKLVVTVNGKTPGPDIVVYEGQTVIVHVKNNLRSVAATIHWHGLHQKNNPHMDGVPWVTQCPIHPGQSFRYKFKASPRGTFWWHAHVGAERSMGLFGALIIKDNKATDVEEHIMQIQDYNHDSDSDTGHMKMLYGVYEGRKKWGGSQSLDGSFFSMFKYHSGLINGKGRYYDPKTGSNFAPLTVYNVKKGRKYRFRVIGVGSLYPFRISVDNHVMTVIASDGYDLEPIVAESFIINPGERFDFEIVAGQPADNYWIRGLTLEKGQNHKAEAILRYEGAPDEDPTSSRKQCSQQDPCLVLNCPFTYYPANFTMCKKFDELKALATDDPAPPYKKDGFKEYFLNFAFPGITSYPGSVNGRTYDQPDVNLLTQPTEWHSPCESPTCDEGRHCKCTFALQIGNNDTVQMVFMNMGRGKGWSHPIHMHGHSFYVLKMGYGQYNPATAEIGADNSDIDCRGHSDQTKTFCNDATWSNSSWLDGNVPGMELERPTRKDTVIVPTGGYVVLRIRANNPGVWIMHCHIELHNLDGMVMLLNESYTEVPKIPDDFPECHSFPPNKPRRMAAARGMQIATDNKPKPDPEDDDEDTISRFVFWVVSGALLGVVLLQFLILLIVCGYVVKRRTSSEKYAMGATNGAFQN